jgi:type IV pilus assembly protein PilV
MPVKNLHINKKQHGFSLIEVMISVVVLSLGLLTLSNLQTRSVSNSTVAYGETQTMMFLQEMIEHLRSDKAAAINGDYNIALSAFSDLTAGDGTEPFAEKERFLWFNNLDKAIPGAKASINCDNTSLCVVEVQHTLSGNPQKKALAIIL